MRLEPEVGLFQDGDQLPGGKVISKRRGYPVAVYRCGCDREQAAECGGFTGGISENAAQSLGWKRPEPENDAGWTCPFCSGQTEKLFQLFNGTTV